MRHLLGSLILASACATPAQRWQNEYAQTHPTTAHLAEVSLEQGCPVTGAPAAPLRRSLGRPLILPGGDSTSATWRFALSNRSMLEAVVKGDTVVRWDVSGSPPRKLARQNYVWSIEQGKGFPRRVINYLNANRDIPPRAAFLLLRACPQPGMAAAALRASWGAPSEIVPSADTTRWIYGYGVEGQYEFILLVSDTVQAYRYVGWNAWAPDQ